MNREPFFCLSGSFVSFSKTESVSSYNTISLDLSKNSVECGTMQRSAAWGKVPNIQNTYGNSNQGLIFTKSTHWSNWKYTSSRIRVFSVWPLPEVENWFLKQTWNENVHISILNFFWSVSVSILKSQKMDFPLYFQILRGRVLGFIFMLEC